MEGESGAVRTAKDGSFRATRLAPGENQRLDVRHDDFEERALGGISLAPGATRSGLTVVMRRGLTLRGLVKDEAGRPLAGAEVGSLEHALDPRRPRRHADGDDRAGQPGAARERRRRPLRVPRLKPGDYAVGARRSGFARASVDPVKMAEGRAAEPIELVLKPGATISGVLHDKGGNGASGWYVSARGAGQGGGPAARPGSQSQRRADRSPTARSCSKA
jgi:hypothetical protein